MAASPVPPSPPEPPPGRAGGPPRLLVEMIHPGHFHVFRPLIELLQRAGWQIVVAGREKDVTVDLLRSTTWDYRVLSTARPGLPALFGELGVRTWRLWRLARPWRPDVILSVGSAPAAYAALLCRCPHVALTDSEFAPEHTAMYRYVTHMILTPEKFGGDLGPRHVRYAGYHELAYLHPQRFTPDPAVLDAEGLARDRPIVFARFVAWAASHDRRVPPPTAAGRRAVLRACAARAQVVVSSETPVAELPPGCRRLQNPMHAHHVLAHAALFVGEGGTMPTEAAVLGVPVVFVNPLQASNWDELGGEYGLMRQCATWAEAMPHVRERIERLEADRDLYRERRARLLADKIDVTAFLVRTLTDVVARRR